MQFADFIHWLNELPFSYYLRESELAFPLTEAVHLIGLGVSVGAIMWVDLRLAGLAMRNLRVSEVVSRLERWAIGGFVLMFVSGTALFLGKPDTYYSTWPFRIKVILMVFAGLNVLLFHKKVYPHVAQWDDAEVTPWQAQLVGYSSLALWVIISILGRLTAYSADPLYRSSMHL